MVYSPFNKAARAKGFLVVVRDNCDGLTKGATYIEMAGYRTAKRAREGRGSGDEKVRENCS